jgi:cytochrome c oxidase assembly protein subunit 15
MELSRSAALGLLSPAGRAAYSVAMQSKMIGKEVKASPWIAAWLWLVALMVFATVIVGGATRLTDSGLSITEWQPIVGTIPPLNETAWREAFSRYQTIPEYQLVNKGISLSQFKTIYWWEWTHRFMARAIGMVFLLPFVAFWLSRRLPRRLIPMLSFVFVLGALQGGLGWYMVKSGLTSRVDVSQYRLAAHLTLASILLAVIVWIALGLTSPARRLHDGRGYRALILIGLVLAQITIGGFMAGIDAGLVTASWPDMNGKLVPDGMFILSPWWRNLFENALTLQFNHRVGAYFIAGFTALHVGLTYRSGALPDLVASALALLGVVLVQFCLGVATVIAAVPFELALLHQAGALLLLVVAVFHLHAATLDRNPTLTTTQLLRHEQFR